MEVKIFYKDCSFYFKSSQNNELPFGFKNTNIATYSNEDIEKICHNEFLRQSQKYFSDKIIEMKYVPNKNVLNNNFLRCSVNIHGCSSFLVRSLERKLESKNIKDAKNEVEQSLNDILSEKYTF
jgi:hypothetical protein